MALIGYGGGGGGGGSARVPVESPDTLRSRQYARLIDLLGEGKCKGPALPGLQWYFVEETPVENSDGSRNFDGITVTTRLGTQDQTHIKGFPSVEAEKPVNVEFSQDTPLVRTVTDPDINSVRVTISLPALYKQDTSTGDTDGAAVQIAIDVQPDGGSYTEVLQDRISGKATSKYQLSYLVAVTGSPPWNIRLRHLNPDTGAQGWQRKTYWDNYTEIIEAKLRYPCSALVATVIDSAQFSSIPSRAFLWDLLETQIPSNATVDPDTGRLTYTGTWDGTFQIAWHSNPAWAFWDMITTGRYGLGDFIDAGQVDKWALYEIGRYCDELVPDGRGGTEPRFSCHIYIQEQQEAFNLVQDLASVFRGMVYWSSGLIAAAQDAPADPVALFTNANVVGGRFSYAGSSLKTRHTVALMSWNDPDNFYRRVPEYVEDPDGIMRWGLVPTSKVVVGCTSRGQAHRAGKWLLYSEARETDVVTFSVGMDGVSARPGQIIQILDRHRAGSRRGGRVATATDTVLTLDRAITPSEGVVYTLLVMLPDGTMGKAVIEEFDGDTVTLATPLPAAPQSNAVWAISSDELVPQTFRVVAVMEGDDGTYEMSALAHDPQKFDHIENDLVLEAAPISLLNTPPETPRNVTVAESLYKASSTVRVLIGIAWDVAERATSYTVSYRRNDNNMITVRDIRAPFFEIRDAQPGEYEIFVSAVAVNGKSSPAASATATILGKTALPALVKNFSLANIAGGVAQLSWAQAADLDVQIGGFVRIRHTRTPGATPDEWNNAVDISPALPGTATGASVPHLPGTYLAKFVDSSGVASADAAVAAATQASMLSLNVVETITESPTFPGSMDNVVYDALQGGLMIDTVALVEDPDLVSQWNYLNADTVVASGVYDFDGLPDLGAVYPCLVTANLGVVAINEDDLWDSDELIDGPDLIDGAAIDDVNAILFISTTEDNPAGSPVWSPWQPIHIGQYPMRAARFKLALTSSNPTHNIVVTSLSVTIDMPDREESDFNISSGAGAKSVTFTNPFKGFRGVGITPLNLQTGDYADISAQSDTGFTVTFRNSAGAAVSRNFNYTAKGYGYRM